MKSTGLIQLVGNLHQAGKIHNLHQVYSGVFGCVTLTALIQDAIRNCPTVDAKFLSRKSTFLHPHPPSLDLLHHKVQAMYFATQGQSNLASYIHTYV